MNNVLQYEVVPAGWFEDGVPAFKLINTIEFMIHGVTVPAGAVGEFRMDEDSEFVSSWIFHKADIRNASIRHTIIQDIDGGAPEDRDIDLIKDCNIRSCFIKGHRTVVRNAELNAITADTHHGSFVAIGTPEENVVFNKVKFHATLNCWNASIKEAAGFMKRTSL